MNIKFTSLKIEKKWISFPLIIILAACGKNGPPEMSDKQKEVYHAQFMRECGELSASSSNYKIMANGLMRAMESQSYGAVTDTDKKDIQERIRKSEKEVEECDLRVKQAAIKEAP